MSCLLDDGETDERAAFLARDFTDRDGCTEIDARDWIPEHGQIVVEVQPLTKMGQHVRYCTGCIICFDDEAKEEAMWRGI